jgi:hypothetical protein
MSDEKANPMQAPGKTPEEPRDPARQEGAEQAAHAAPEAAAAPTEGFDTQEPRYGVVALFGIATVIFIVAAIIGVQGYYDSMLEREVFIRVLQPVSEDLRNLRAEEQQHLHSYQYIDRNKGLVRLPIERAMQLLEEEARAGKVPYNTKPAPVVTDANPAGGGNAAPAGN